MFYMDWFRHSIVNKGNSKTHRQYGDRISLLPIFKRRKVDQKKIKLLTGHNDVSGSGRIASPFFTLSLDRIEQSASHSQSLYSRRKKPWYPLDNRFGMNVIVKGKILVLLGIEHRPFSLYPVAMLTEISRLPSIQTKQTFPVIKLQRPLDCSLAVCSVCARCFLCKEIAYGFCMRLAYTKYLSPNTGTSSRLGIQEP